MEYEEKKEEAVAMSGWRYEKICGGVLSVPYRGNAFSDWFFDRASEDASGLALEAFR